MRDDCSSKIEDWRRAIDLGADDFVQKPTEATELSTRIKSLSGIGDYQRKLHDLNSVLESKVEARTSEFRGTVRRLNHPQKETDLAYRETVLRLTMAAEAKDPCTSARLKRMSHYAALLAEKCGWRTEDTDLPIEAAKMHDIGKLGVSDAILGKDGKLTEQETGIMRQHTEIGEKILFGSQSKLLQMAAAIALTHHEQFDGSGYPQGLRATLIPRVGRIVAIADVFDALMSRRSYKRAWTLQESVAAMSDAAGKHFDPDLLSLFLGDTAALREIHTRFDENSTPAPSLSSPDDAGLVPGNIVSDQPPDQTRLRFKHS